LIARTRIVDQTWRRDDRAVVFAGLNMDIRVRQKGFVFVSQISLKQVWVFDSIARELIHDHVAPLVYTNTCDNAVRSVCQISASEDTQSKELWKWCVTAS